MIKKILLIVLAVVVVAVLGIVIYVQATWNKKYDWPAPALKSTTDSATIARGSYLVNGPAHCRSCHISGFADMVASDEGKDVDLKGGYKIAMNPLGNLYTKNLTPDKETGLGRYTDEQVFRMMRHAIRPDGTASMPLIMPFFNMADEDLVAVVSYLRSLTPVKNVVPDNEWTFIGKAVRALTPTFKPVEKPEPPPSAPPMVPTVERGKYLAHYVTNCVGCHTPRDMMTFQAIGPEFSGGLEFEPDVELNKYMKVDPDLWLRTPNLTPDPGSALAKYPTPEAFIKRFRQGRLVSISPMDWGPFSRMSDEDITAIWKYLNSLPPVKNDIAETMFKKDKS